MYTGKSKVLHTEKLVYKGDAFSSTTIVKWDRSLWTKYDIMY